MSSSGAVYEVTSEHARITQPQAPDYFSIPWNDDFSTESFFRFFIFVLSFLVFLHRSVVLWLLYVDNYQYHAILQLCSIAASVIFAVVVWRVAVTHSGSERNWFIRFNVPCLETRNTH